MKGFRIVAGCLIVSIGVYLLHSSSISTGGTVGLSLSLAYLMNLSFSLSYVLVNLPFYVLSIRRMGWRFTGMTILSVSLLSLLSISYPYLPILALPAWSGAIVGGLVIGFGMALLLMSGASLGGSNILALVFQQKYGWNPGITMLLFDSLVVLLSFSSIGLVRGLYSVLSLLVLSAVISFYKSRFLQKPQAPAAIETVRADMTGTART